MTPLEAVLLYIERFGFHPVPIPYRAKAPVIDGWQNLEITAANAGEYFNGAQMNVGVRLGDPYHLTDLDFDVTEALAAWQEFALETYHTFGHRSKPASHAFFFPDEPVRSRRYLDPAPKPGAKACLMELRSMKSDGTYGLQTVVPPSVHESGEPIEFSGGFAGEPAKVTKADLERAANLTAACALLGRHAPADGARHEFFLALAGALAHAKRPLSEASAIVRAVYRVLWGPRADLGRAEKEVETTFRRYDDGGEVTGLPHLANLIDGRIFPRVMEWLGIKGDRKPPPPKPQSTAARLKMLQTFNLEALMAQQTHTPGQLIEDLLPNEGATLVYGPQKVNKTIFGAQSAFAAATGKALFEYFRVLRPGASLFIEQDDPGGTASMQDIVKKWGLPPGTPFHFVAKDESLMLGPDFAEWLESRIKDLHLVLVVLDSYTALRGPRPPGSDLVKHEAGEITLIDEIGKRTHCLIELIHHDSKGAINQDWTAKAGGSYGMTMATESQIHISRFADLPMEADQRLLRMQGRHLQSRQVALAYRNDLKALDLLLEGPGASHYPLILHLQTEFGSTPFTAKLLMETTGQSRATTFRQLSALTQSSVIQKLGDGSYRLALFERKRPV